MRAQTTCKLVVLISGSGSNLQAIIDATKNSATIQVSAVISNKADAYGLVRAQSADIPTHILNHKDYAGREAFDQALVHCIDQYQPDLVVLAGFMRILTPVFTEHYTGRLFNIHPSLLPKHKGLNTHARALEEGDAQHGCSVHFVTAELDGGPVVIQAKLDIKSTDTANTLAQRVHLLEHQIYPMAIQWFAQQRLQLTAQGASLDGELLPVTGHTLYNKEI
ncbi:phosphoribosylglycinamide formyltransferase [Pseudomonas sp. F1_0610]|uniref:phosphoribosylglycinamide formyltransferase n=1 Tax=Pseudomonas sp. F1_0610 TaxID=3114284 RepID=UPI0039C4A111